MPETMTRRAARLLMRVCDPRQPDWKTSRADARAAISLAEGVHPDDIDSLGYEITARSYAASRDSWVHHIEEHGWNEDFFGDQLAPVRADWARRLPELAAADSD